MNSDLIFDPLVPLVFVWLALAVVTVSSVLFAFWHLRGWHLRAVAAALVVLAMANPSLQQEERDPLSSILLVLVDETASQQQLPPRAAQTRAALAALTRKANALPQTELRVVPVGDAQDNRGTLLVAAMNRALADIPDTRLAGVVVISDGIIHDTIALPVVSGAPVHLLLSGTAQDIDRRITVKNAPGFAILGEPVSLTVRVDDLRATPAEVVQDAVSVVISVNDAPPVAMTLPIGQDVALPVTLSRGGGNTLRFHTPELSGELTTRNNTAIVRMNGVRDRLRVLLVSGEPHPGERTWRNLLKADSSVDLVHFTILRPPEKQDGVPVGELSLIAFPTRELFLEKVDEFDLIIFDRYQRRGILPSVYLDSVRDYVLKGGAVLVAAGPDYATVNSLWHSGLADVLPAGPTARVLEGPFLPHVSALGRRHPVTRGLVAAQALDAANGVAATGEDRSVDPTAQTGPTAPTEQPGEIPPWGRWFRQVEVVARPEAQVIMTGPGQAPLLVLGHAGEGRVALLGSDHSWLWSRGFEGGGPQGELLRRLAHWMMREPGLEEERLEVQSTGQTMAITRQTLGETVGELTLTGPDGTTHHLTPEPADPGRFTATWQAPEPGLWRLSDGALETLVALGPAAPREFRETRASDDGLAPLISDTGGAVFRIEDTEPDLRLVRPGRPASGRGWIGATQRAAYQTTGITLKPLLPAWAMLLLMAGLTLGAWFREGRR